MSREQHESTLADGVRAAVDHLNKAVRIAVEDGLIVDLDVRVIPRTFGQEREVQYVRLLAIARPL